MVSTTFVASHSLNEFKSWMYVLAGGHLVSYFLSAPVFSSVKLNDNMYLQSNMRVKHGNIL